MGATAVLFVTLYPIGRQLIKAAIQERCQKDMRTVAMACRQYYASHGRWPDNVEELYPDFLPLELSADEYSLYPQYRLLKVVYADHRLSVVKPTN